MKEHNCEEHLIEETWCDEQSMIGRIEKCSICGRIKYHWEYGTQFIKDWEEVGGELDDK